MDERNWTASRFDGIVANFERDYGIEAVTDGKPVLTKEQALTIAREQFRSVNVEFYNSLSEADRTLIDKLVDVKVNDVQMPTLEDLYRDRSVQRDYSTPHHHKFSLDAERSVDVVVDKEGNRYLLAQGAIKVGIYDQEQVSRAERSDNYSRVSPQETWMSMEWLVPLAADADPEAEKRKLNAGILQALNQNYQKANEILARTERQNGDLVKAGEEVRSYFSSISLTPLGEGESLEERREAMREKSGLTYFEGGE
jgi:hypothetical protein